MSTPQPLQRIVDLFASAPKDLRLQALLEYSRKVPELPAAYASNRALMEKVPECQTPFFLATELDEATRVTLHFDVPAEAPTTRGFAGVLHAGLNGATATEVLDTPNDFYLKMGLGEAISALRLRGMSAILGRLKRQVADHLAVDSPADPPGEAPADSPGDAPADATRPSPGDAPADATRPSPGPTT